jgi:alpha-ribazole phosphatase
MSALWLVRHAPVAVAGICYGQRDVPVALEAERAAELVVERWQAAGQASVPELWSSPWARARDVADALARRWGTEHRVDDRLSELSFGAWEGRRFEDIQREDGARFERWMRDFDVEAPPGGETVAELRTRLAAWLEDRRRSPATVLAVTHAGVMRMARALTRSVSYVEVVAEPVEHLTPERLDLRGRETQFGISRT